MLTARRHVVSLTIEKPAAGGAMIARHDGQVVLVSGAIPGERVRARIVRVRRASRTRTTVDGRSSRRPIAASRRGDPLVRRLPVRAHRATRGSSRSRAQVIADAFARIGAAPLPAGGGRRVAGGRATACARGCTCAADGIGFFREGTPRSLRRRRQTRQLLPATIDVLDRARRGRPIARLRRSPRNRAVGERRRVAARRAPRRRPRRSGARALDLLGAHRRSHRPRVEFRRSRRRPRRRSHRRRSTRDGADPSARARVLSGQPLPAARSGGARGRRRCRWPASVLDLYAGGGLFRHRRRRGARRARDRRRRRPRRRRRSCGRTVAAVSGASRRCTSRSRAFLARARADACRRTS